MRVGIVGAGRLGTVLARLAPEAVVTSRTRPEPAAFATDVVVLALPLARVFTLDPALVEGRLVVDATNYWWAADGIHREFADPRTSTSELVQRWLVGSRVVKGLNHMGYHDLEDEARPSGAPGRKAIAVAGDSDVETVAALIDRLGFDAVHAGPLAEGVRFEPDTELFGADVDADEVRAMLARFPSSARGRVVARARAGLA